MARDFVKGDPSAYKVYRDGLTPEQLKDHMAERRKRASDKKGMKEAWEATVKAQREQWIALFNNKALQILEDGGAHEFATIFDRTVGKPEQKVEQKVVTSISFTSDDDDDKE